MYQNLSLSFKSFKFYNLVKRIILEKNMKLYLVISLALWQTSNGKYVNEEYEPEEIQDQVFEVSKLYNCISNGMWEL